MSESPIKESDIPALSNNGSSVEQHSNVVDSACNARQNRPSLIPSRSGFLTAALPESSLQGTSTDLESAFTFFLSRMEKMKSNVANVTKTNNLLHERITAPRSRIRFLFTLIHQNIKGMIWVRK